MTPIQWDFIKGHFISGYITQNLTLALCVLILLKLYKKL